MARHSHFKTIKEKKEFSDKKRAQMFSKIRREIALAIKYGKDPLLNPYLKTALEKAKRANMPKETIERVLKRERGEGLEEIILEIIGPGKTSIILKAITDNKNRTRSRIKEVVEKFGGKIVEPNTLRWQFKKIAKFFLKRNEEKEGLEAIEMGAEDVSFRKNEVQAIFPLEKLKKIKEEFKKRKIKIEKINIEWIPILKIKVTKERKEKNFLLFKKLLQIEEVKGLYFNF